MSVEVYIAEQLVDLSPATVVALTKQINDIAEIQKRQADYTNRFSAPWTPNNKIIAEHLNVPGNSSTRPYKWAAARIVMNGITITSSGIALLTETRQNVSYEYIIYAGNYDLFSKIEGKYITDIDWSDLEHLFDMYAWEAKNTLSTTDGYIYPIIETLDGRLTKTTADVLRVDMNYQFPHVFVKTIWDRIFSEAGLEYYGDFFSTNTKFPKQVVPACRNWMKEITTPMDYFNGNNPLSTNEVFYDRSDPIEPISYQLDVNTVVYASANYDDTTDKYTAPEDGKYSFTLKSFLAAEFLYRQYFRIKINGVYSPVESFIELKIISSFGLIQKETALVIDVLLREGDEVEFFTEMRSADTDKFTDALLLNFELEIRQISREPIAYGSTIDFSKWLPKIKQLDFLKAIMQQYGLMYQIDNQGKYSFITIEDLLNRLGGVTDMSDKLHGESSETYSIGAFSKKNNLRYQYHEDDKNGEGYADSSFDIDIDNLPTEGTVVDNIMQASGDWLFFDNWEKIASIHAYRNAESDPVKPPLYVLNDNDKLQTVILATAPTDQVQMYDSLTDTVLGNYLFFSDILAVAQFQSLHWETLIDDYYPMYVKMVRTPVKKKALLYLTPIDLYFLDMFKVLYFSKYQSYFYLNKANGFVPNKLTDCEIIKIN